MLDHIYTSRSVLSVQAHPSRHGNGNVKQPGSAEALKQVLFRLHAVEAQLQQQQQQEASATPEVEVPQQQVQTRPGQQAG